MPSLLTGVAADPTTAPTATGPSSGDLVSAAPSNAEVQLLLNYLSWLRTHGAWNDQTNTFTQAQNIQGALTLSSGLAMTGGAAQSLTKSGGGYLAVGTLDTNPLKLIVNNAAGAEWDITNAGNLQRVGGAGTVTGLPTPTNSSDAATKGYVDAAPIVSATAGFVWASGFSNAGGTTVSRSGRLCAFSVKATCTTSGTAPIVTFPTGYRPVFNPACTGQDNLGNAIAFVLGTTIGFARPADAVAGRTYYIDGVFMASDA